MKSRRAFIGKSALFMLTMFSQTGESQSSSPIALPSGIGNDPDFDGPIPPLGGELGKLPALRAEQQLARTILARAPNGPLPVDVADYFLAVGRGDFAADWKPYTMGWPERWNPVIVTFFQATGTSPEGDTTSWCAAFVNWCFQQVTGTPATKSASSSSFRTFGDRTLSPTKGDIVVFQNANPDAGSARHGHVGFFVRDHGVEVEVLGGNQIDGHDRSHMISSKRLMKDGPALKLHSYRTDSRLILPAPGF